jgi:hypothetical protein
MKTELKGRRAVMLTDEKISRTFRVGLMPSVVQTDGYDGGKGHTGLRRRYHNECDVEWSTDTIGAPEARAPKAGALIEITAYLHLPNLLSATVSLQRSAGSPIIRNGRKWKGVKMGERYGNLLTNGLSGAQHVFYEELSNYRNFQRLRVYGGDDCSRSEAGTSFEDMSKPSEVSYARSVTQVKRDDDLVRRLKRALVQPSLPSVRLGRRGDDPSPADYERMWAARAMSIQRRGDVRTQRRRERKRLVHEVRRAKDGVPQTKKHKARPPDPELYMRLKRQLDGWPEDRDPDDEEEEEADSEGVEEPSYEDNEVPNPRQPTARGVIRRPQQRRQQKKKTKTKTMITTKSRKQKKKTTTETNASAPAAANAPEPAGEMHVDLTGDTEKDIYYAEEPEGALPEGALYTPAGVGPFTRERLIEAWRQHRVQSYTLEIGRAHV